MRAAGDRWPIFAFIDQEVSPDQFYVFYLRQSFLGSLLDAVSFGGAFEADGYIMVETPGGDVYKLMSMGSSYDSSLWVERAKAAVVSDGAQGLASLGTSRRFSRRYG